MLPRHGLIPRCIRCGRVLPKSKPPSPSHSDLNSKSYGTASLKRNSKRSSKNDGQNSSQSTHQPAAIKNTEQHLQSAFIQTPKTKVVKRARLPTFLSNPDANYVQNAWKYHLSTSPSQCQTDVKRRARLIPQNTFMDNSVLNSILSRMFGKSIESTAPHNAGSNCPSLNANFFDSFVPPKLTPRRDVVPFVPSPNSQVIRKLTKIRQLQKRSFSQSCIQPTVGSSDLPRTSAEISLLAKRRDSGKPAPKRRIRMALRRVPGKRLRKLQGPPIIPASSLSISKYFLESEKYAALEFNRDPFMEDITRIIHHSKTTNSYSSQPLGPRELGIVTDLLRPPDEPPSWRGHHSKPTNSYAPQSLGSREAVSKSVDNAKQLSQPPGELSSLPSLSSLLEAIHEMLKDIKTATDKSSNMDNASPISTSFATDSQGVKTFLSDKTPVSAVLSQRTTGLLRQLPFGESVLTDVVTLEEQPPIARLAHGLDRVLFNQSVHWLQDPHSKVFNFPPDLQTLPSVTDFAFERLPKYKSGGEDDCLLDLAVRYSKPFIGSTSTLTKILSHIYFLISEDKLVDTSTLSMAYVDQSRRFTPGMRMPASFTLHPRPTPDGSAHLQQVYAVDPSRSEIEERHAEWNLLLWLGTMMEKLLTYPKEQFDSLRRQNPPTFCFKDRKETYRYAKSSKFIMRSQLDCQDSRLPGTGVFDLKSRAVLPVRIDQLNVQEHRGYLIRQTTGLFESFEREYYDLIRSAFLKYNFQARIGNMDGIFVAYHNTARLFGFQYVPVTEMEDRLYGPGHPDRGHRIFEKCVGLMESIMERITNCFPGHSLSCTMETREDTNQLVIWVVPVNYHAYPAPIEEFIVTVRHMVNNLPVDGKVAIERAHQDWSIQYLIVRSSKSQEQIWSSLKRCQRRAEFAMVLPEGVSMDQAREQFNSVNWKAGSGFKWNREDESPGGELTLASRKAMSRNENTGPKLRATAHGLIRKLRSMARRGTKDLTKQNAIEAKRPKVMWGRDHDVVGGNVSSHPSSTNDLDTTLDTSNDDVRNTIDADQTPQLDSVDDHQTTRDLDGPA